MKTKTQKLDEYVSEGNKVFRIDVNKLGFNNADRAIFNYCIRNYIKLKKVNEFYWIKTDSDEPLSTLLKINRTIPRCTGYTLEEALDTLRLPYPIFHKKYPNRTYASYQSKRHKEKIRLSRIR